MAILGGFDVHRRQVSYDYVDTKSGRVWSGRIEPACRETLRGWLAKRFAGRDDAAFAVEGCTGWRFIVEELARAGVAAQLAEPAGTANLRGNKRQPKTDRTDSRHLRRLLVDGRVPQSWVPPEQVLEVRAVLQLYRDLCEERTAWSQRVHATLFHQGVPSRAGRLSNRHTRHKLSDDPAAVGLSAAGALTVRAALRRIDELDGELDAVYKQIASFARRQPGCKALQQLRGVGPLTAAALWAYLGDTRRFSSSAKAVRYVGLDVTVYSSDGKRLSHGYLSRQGEPMLRWLLYEAAHQAARRDSPDHGYYAAVAERVDSERAALSMARKIVRRAHHILRQLGDDALAPVPGWQPVSG